ncbi:MAG TPA: SpoIIE family protein phosphatase [Gemmatimonadales bacterium]|nr:SpoIIE family protein phosphatase [Gemmatimonadales bacterium]
MTVEPCAPTSPLLEWGVATAVRSGEQVSGDAHLVCPFAHGVLLAVVDGLGHGRDAAAAAERAVHTLRVHARESVIGLMRRCHDALAGTRGVVMSLAVFDGAEHTLTWLAVGNIRGVLVRADPRAVPRTESQLARSGVVGLQLPILQAAVTTVAPGDLVVFATDGVESSFTGHVTPARPQAMADRLLEEYGRSNDDALVLVGRYRGG